MNRSKALSIAIACLAAAACGCGGEEAPPADRTGSPEPATAPGSKAPAAEATARAPLGDDQQAPAEYTVKLETTEGEVLIDVHRDWAPRGADRFYTLVRDGFYDDSAFFRVLDGFMAQTGLNGDPAVTRAWRDRRIPDDPVTQSNQRGTVSFATSGRDSRTTQFFINFGDNGKLDGMGFAPFGKVRDMTAVDKLYSGYGEGFPKGSGPSQQKLHMQGNAYLKAEFPELDYVVSARVVE